MSHSILNTNIEEWLIFKRTTNVKLLHGSRHYRANKTLNNTGNNKAGTQVKREFCIVRNSECYLRTKMQQVLIKGTVLNIITYSLILRIHIVPERYRR